MLRLRYRLLASDPASTAHTSSSKRRLSILQDFGSNPGELDAWTYLPPGVKTGASLVVVLHGCTQTAAGYDYHAGWSALADRYGFVVLLPGQNRANNPNLCFNWFAPRDARRGRGEALSIAQMIETVHQRHGTNRNKVYVTGLSAGGAMTVVMLATYPELFAGGAIISGLPFGTANNVPQALERMRGQELPNAAILERLARSASDFGGPWPTISVWHGTLDPTVAPVNAKATIDQWRQLHGLGETPTEVQAVGHHTRRVWLDQDGREVLEAYEIKGMSHGAPLSTSDPESEEVAGPNMLEAGVSSTRKIAHFWGLEGLEPSNSVRLHRRSQTATPAPKSQTQPVVAAPPVRPTNEITSTIEKALRSAGLLR